MFGAFNLISVAFAVLFVGLGVDFGIQFCVCYRAKRHRNDDLHAALRDAAADVGAPLALAACVDRRRILCVPADRLSRCLGARRHRRHRHDRRVHRQVTLLPALLALLRPRGERLAVGYPALAALDRCCCATAAACSIAAVVVAAVGCALLPRLRFDFNPLHLRSADAESVATLLDLMKDPDTTPDTIDVLVPSVAAGTALAQQARATAGGRPRARDHDASYPTIRTRSSQLIDDAALLLDPTLEPAATRPPPDDAELARAMTRTSQSLDEAGRAHAGGPFAVSAATARTCAAGARRRHAADARARAPGADSRTCRDARRVAPGAAGGAGDACVAARGNRRRLGRT